MDKVIQFKELYNKFLEATRYMVKKRQELGRTEEFERLEDKFIKRIVEPMEKAWLELTNQERETVFYSPEGDPEIRKVLEIFKGKVVEVSEVCH